MDDENKTNTDKNIKVDLDKLANDLNKQISLKKEDSDNLININTNKMINDDESDIESSAKEVRVAVVGNVDSGKSTLVGVLTKCTLDDGRGYARQLVFNYSHERENGRTSSIAQEIMGFKGTTQIEPHKTTDKKNNQWAKIVKDSDKIVTIIDLCGHEKYLKTTIFGLTGLAPDYAMVVIGANMGVQRMTKEHLGIALALKVPIIVVITKIDIAPDEIYKQTLDYIIKTLKKTGAGKMPVIVRDKDDVTLLAENIASDRISPIFCVSSVSGEGINQLRLFMSSLNSRISLINSFKPQTDKVEFHIDASFNVKGVGLVVSGVLVSGTVSKDQLLKIGPDLNGEFKQVAVKSIHFKRIVVDEITSGNSCCFQIKSKDNIKQSDIRKGMVLVDKDSNPKCVFEFDAEVVILHHATTIKEKYQAVVHCGVIRQTAQVISMNTELLRTGDKGIVKFRFIKSPEYLHEGASILFREGRTRGLGQITKLYYN